MAVSLTCSIAQLTTHDSLKIRKIKPIEKALFILLLTSCLCLQANKSASASSSNHTLEDPSQDSLMTSAGFLFSHPDLRYQLLCLNEMNQVNHKEALHFFQRATYYADKPSQGMVGEMLWNGQGSKRDPAPAYAWMDLAAKRGYTSFPGLRERYWNSLSAEQKSRALDEGKLLYAKSGDSAAQPRIVVILRRGKRRSAGSRTGLTGSTKICVVGPAGFEQPDKQLND